MDALLAAAEAAGATAMAEDRPTGMFLGLQMQLTAMSGACHVRRFGSEFVLTTFSLASRFGDGEEFVGDSRPPSSLFWSDVLNKSTKETDEKKRLRWEE